MSPIADYKLPRGRTVPVVQVKKVQQNLVKIQKTSQYASQPPEHVTWLLIKPWELDK